MVGNLLLGVQDKVGDCQQGSLGGPSAAVLEEGRSLQTELGSLQAEPDNLLQAAEADNLQAVAADNLQAVVEGNLDLLAQVVLAGELHPYS